MNLHSGARTCPQSRELLARRVRHEGWTVKEAGTASGISRTTAHKWLRRFDEEGSEDLFDRSSRPDRSPAQTPSARVEVVLELRHFKMNEHEIAKRLRLKQRTVSRIILRAGLSRARDLEPPRQPNRYEHAPPGDPLHLDIKNSGASAVQATG